MPLIPLFAHSVRGLLAGDGGKVKRKGKYI